MRLFILVCCTLLGMDLHAFTITMSKADDACGNGGGWARTQPIDGISPFTYLWSNGATTYQASGLSAGVYSVVVTDANGDTGSGSVTVVTLPALDLVASVTSFVPDCFGACEGMMRVVLAQSGGVGPYSYSYTPAGGSATTGTAPANNPTFFIPGLCSEQDVLVTATDANGCMGSATITLAAGTAVPTPPFTVTDACAGYNNGSVTIDMNTGNYWDGSAMYVLGPGPQDTVPWFDEIATGLAPGDYTIRVTVLPYRCVPDSYFTIEDQASCGAVMGTAFVDLDQDCLIGPNDPVLAYRPIVVQPGNVVSLTDVNGAFNIPLEYGSYTLEQPDPNLSQLCPPTAPYPFTLTAIDSVHTVLLADSVIGGIDLSVHFTASWAIPGFVQTTWITVRNLSPYTSGPISLSFDHESIFTYVGSSETPLSTTTGNVTWDLAGLPPFGTHQVELQLQIPADPDLIGTTYSVMATITSAGDTYTANNAFDVVGSYDPNDITARTTAGSRSDYVLDTDEDIVYTIRFQNTGNFPAQNIHILDTLSELLDMARIEILGASHAFTAAYEDGRTLRFDFPNIQLPDSTNDAPNSHGYVSYRIVPVASLTVGAVIENTAGIYFDFNPAVITNTSVVTVQTALGIEAHGETQLRVMPNPARGELQVLRNGQPIVLARARIIAIDGRQLPLDVSGSYNGMINVGHLATGVYLLDLQDNSGHTSRVRFVKE